MTTGDRIKEARKKKGLTQKELGKLLNVSQQMIGQYESGDLNNIEIIKKIAKILDVSMNDLLGLEKDATKELINTFYGLIDKEPFEKTINVIKDYYAKNLGIDIDKAEDREKILINNIIAELNNLNLEGKKEILKRIKELNRLDEYADTNNKT